MAAELTPKMAKALKLCNKLVEAVNEKIEYEAEIKSHLEEAKIIKSRLPNYQKRIDEAQTAYDAISKEIGI